jgi:chromosome segregation ATPase
MQYEISDPRVIALDSQVTDLEETVRKLGRQQHQFDDLGNSLDELRGELESLQRAVEDNEGAARDQLGELTEKLEELESNIGDVTRTLHRLGDRTSWIEHHIRTSGAATEIKFDDQAAELAPFVRKVKQGQQAQAQLLDDVARHRLERSVGLFEHQAQRIDELTAAALQASTILTTTIYGESEHTDAARAFRTAFETRRSETKQHLQQQAQIEQARTRLAQDDQQRNAHATTIQGGKDAAQTMRLRIRTTIAEALGDAALPPVWFTTALGFTPARGDADEWLDTATEVLAYRFTYGITDPILALGVKPDANNRDRYHWYRELLDKLRRYTG